VCVCDVCENPIFQTCSLSVFVFSPEVADGSALEDEEEEVRGTEYHDNGECCVDHHSLVSFAGESEEVGGDREFGDSC